MYHNRVTDFGHSLVLVDKPSFLAYYHFFLNIMLILFEKQKRSQVHYFPLHYGTHY